LNAAEIIKHTANAYLSMKISFINMVSDLCEAADADVMDVARGIGLDPRIGPSFLQAGVGYGGFCFPKDLNAFIHVATERGVDFSLLKEVKNVNDARIEQFLRKAQKALWVLKDKRLAVWGLAFKPQTDDIREAPSLKIVQRLQEAGCLLNLYDPQAGPEFQKVIPAQGERLRYCASAEEAAEQVHAILLVTEWPEFVELDWKRLRTRVAVPIVVDGRNCLDPAVLAAAGFEYHGMGRPSQIPKPRG
jgi:UDPglucose 6-dehydrogenase